MLTNRIEFSDLLIPFRNKKKFTLFIFFSIFLILLIEIIFPKIINTKLFQTKLFVTNIDLEKKELILADEYNKYFHMRRNYVLQLFSQDQLDKNEDYKAMLLYIKAIVNKEKKENSYIELNIIKNRKDRFRIQIKSKNLNKSNNLTKIVKQRFNGLVKNLYIKDLSQSIELEKTNLPDYELQVKKRAMSEKNKIRRMIILQEKILNKRMNLKAKKETIERGYLEFIEKELKALYDRYIKFTNNIQKTKEKIKFINFINTEKYEEFNSLEKNNIKIRYILQVLSFFISYSLVLFYSVKRKDNNPNV